MINLLTGLKLLLFAMQYIFNELGHMPANSLFTFIYSISSSRTPPSLCTPFKTPSSVHHSPPTTNPGPNKRSWSPKGLIHSKVRTSRCLARYISHKPVFPFCPVLVITLSLFMFAGFLWLLISPLIFKTKHIPAHIDPENAYFLEKDKKGPSPFSYERKPPSYNYRHWHYRSPTNQANPKMSTQWLKAQSAWTTTSMDPLTTPPPAYRSISTRTTPSVMDSTTFSSFVYTPTPAYKANRRAFRKSTIPSINITRSPTIPPISRPIPHPDSPLPGPRLDLELDDRSDTTFLRPNTTPRESESASINHTPAAHPPMPCTAVVHANNNANTTAARIETNDNGHDNPDSNPRVSWRFSQFFVDWDKQDFFATSINDSKIGIAL